MKRKEFIKTMSLFSLAGFVAPLQAISDLSSNLSHSPLMPVFFFGHGSPMNAIELNEFSLTWQKIGQNIPKPQVVLCISAHWLTNGTYITAMQQPKTIHDFGGFPQSLFEVQYSANGSPELALQISDTINYTSVKLDHEWGLDHGCWSVLTHLYPQADIPVVQLSIDYQQSASYHFALAKELASLRKKGVLIIGSGNMVHNLRMVAWNKIQESEYGFDWAIEANEWMKQHLKQRNYQPLLNYEQHGEALKMAIPTPDHYYPMIYAMALQEKDEQLSFFNDKPVLGSLTMTSFRIDKLS